jgi:hypothetical protein
MRFRACGKGGRFFMSDTNPLNIVGRAIESVMALSESPEKA